MEKFPKSHYLLKSGDYFVPDMAVVQHILITPDAPAPREQRKELFSYEDVAITITGAWDNAQGCILYTLVVNPEAKADKIKQFIIEGSDGTAFSVII